MENSFQTSFIPKKPIVEGAATGAKPKGSINIAMVVTVFIFIVTAAAGGGLYFYKDYLTKNREDLSLSLAKIRDSFDKGTIAELEMYDKRATVVKERLAKHIVLSPLFETINNLTLSTIQYTTFEHSLLKDVFTVRMKGVARDYKSIALQANVFNTDKGKMLKDVIFSNLIKDKSNRVTFDVEFSVNPELLSYPKNVANLNTKTEQGPETSLTENTNTTVTDTVNQVVNTNQQLSGTNNTQ